MMWYIYYLDKKYFEKGYMRGTRTAKRSKKNINFNKLVNINIKYISKLIKF